MKRDARKANYIAAFRFEDVDLADKMKMMKTFTLFLSTLCCAAVALADEDFKSAIVTTADLTINLAGNRTMKIVNFVQEQGNDARVKVMKDGNTAIVLAADKNVHIAGPASVTVTKPAAGNVHE